MLFDGSTYEQANAFLNRGRTAASRDHRNIGNNTKLQRNGDDIDVILHATAIISYHPDNTTTLRAGGWHTVTTKARMNYLTHAYVWSNKGVWQVGEVGRTPVRNIQCSECHGVPFDDSETTRQLLALSGKHVREDCTPWIWCSNCVRPCHGCNGVGRRNVGGKPIGQDFYDGIRIDDEGNVI